MPDFHAMMLYLRAWAAARADELTGEDERGNDLATTVILVAVLAVAAITIGAILVAKFTHKAECIPTDSTTPANC